MRERSLSREMLGVAALLLWGLLWSPGVGVVSADDDVIASEMAPATRPSRRQPYPSLVPEASGPSCQAGTGPAKKLRAVQRALESRLEQLRAGASTHPAISAPVSARIVPLDGRGYRYAADAAVVAPAASPPPARATR